MRRLLVLFEPFVMALLGTVLLASLFPARGVWVGVAQGFADLGIVLLFFLNGAKLSRQAIWDGIRAWHLHLATLGVTYLVFPLLGLGFSAASAPWIGSALAAGILFLTLLPSTVQSSIAFTSIAHGNVPAAICSASFSNLLGIFITPLLAALLIGGEQAGFSTAAAEKIALQLLLPFVVGHLARPLVGKFIERNKQLVGFVDRGSILLVVYAAFGAAVVEGLWRQVSGRDLVALTLLCTLLLAAGMAVTIVIGRMMGLKRADATVLLFCGSKKSLTAGVPLAGVLFPAAQVGMLILPVMLFHQVQLIACAFIARRLALKAEQ